MKRYLPQSFLIAALVFHFSSVQLSAQCAGTFCTIPSPSVNAEDACILPNPSALDCYSGTTTVNPPESLPPSWCTTVENNHFFAFIADAPSISFQICTGACSSGTGIQAALLSTTDCINFEFASACLGDIATQECQSLVANGLTVGNVYYLMIDGSAGAICDYTINGSIPVINGPATGICLNDSSSIYSNGSVVSWSINPPTAGNILGNPVAASVKINWTSAGPAQVCAQSLDCPNYPITCVDLVVGEHMETTDTVELCENYTVECGGQIFTSAGNYTVTLPSYLNCDSTVHCIVKVVPSSSSTQNIELCQGKSVFCAGIEFFTPGNFPVTFSSFQGCDSIVHCLIKILPSSFVNLGTKFVCQGECFQLGDSLYCNPGSYEQHLTSSLGCDSTLVFELAIIQIQHSATIQAPQGQTITCLQPNLSLQGQNIPLVSHIWKNSSGNILSTGNSIVVHTPGYYFHETRGTLAGATCMDEAKILIKQNNTPPPVTATGGMLDAAHPTVQLMGHSIISGVTYHWTGPNGFSSFLKKPIVSVPGIYTLTVTNPQTGCSNSISVEVMVML